MGASRRWAGLVVGALAITIAVAGCRGCTSRIDPKHARVPLYCATSPSTEPACLTTFAVQLRDSALCTKLPDPEKTPGQSPWGAPRSACYASVASFTGESKLCDEISPPDLACYVGAAAAKVESAPNEAPAICARLAEVVKDQDALRRRYVAADDTAEAIKAATAACDAVVQKRYDLCATLEKPIDSQCSGLVGAAARDPKMCAVIWASDDRNRRVCVNNLARQLERPSSCEVGGEVTRCPTAEAPDNEESAIAFAIATKDPAVCTRMRKSGDTDRCLAIYSLRTDERPKPGAETLESCSLMKSPEWRRICETGK